MTAVDLDALDKLRGALAAALDDLPVSPVSLYAAISRLLPVVDRIANARAAAELLDMADLLMKAHDVGPARRLRNRAAALGVYRAKAHDGEP